MIKEFIVAKIAKRATTFDKQRFEKNIKEIKDLIDTESNDDTACSKS